MKKRFAAIAVILAFVISGVLFAAGCAAKSAADFSESEKGGLGGPWSNAAPSAAPQEAVPPMPGEYTKDGGFAAEDAARGGGVAPGIGVIVRSNMSADKIIYSANADIETIEFDNSVQAVYDLLEKYDGFIESSRITGKDYYTIYYETKGSRNKNYRNAYFGVRVPKEKFEEAINALSEVGHVTTLSSNAQNITEQYYDTETRLKAYQTEEARLLEILAKAETVEDLITVETRLSELRYQIDSITSTIKNWDNQVNFSFITINIREVEEITEQVPVVRTYWQEIADALKSTLKGLRDFFKWLLKFIIAALPVFAVIAVIAVPVLLVLKKKGKLDMPGRRKDKTDNNQQ